MANGLAHSELLVGGGTKPLKNTCQPTNHPKDWGEENKQYNQLDYFRRDLWPERVKDQPYSPWSSWTHASLYELHVPRCRSLSAANKWVHTPTKLKFFPVGKHRLVIKHLAAWRRSLWTTFRGSESRFHSWYHVVPFIILENWFVVIKPSKKYVLIIQASQMLRNI